MKNISQFSRAFFCASLVLLAGCAWWPFSKSKSSIASTGSGEILATINGKPLLTSTDYEEKLAMARQANPQVEMILAMMPNAEKEFIFKGILVSELMKAWAQEEGIEYTAEFQKQRRQLHEAVDAQLYMKAFDEAHPVQVGDSEVASFYEEKKDAIPGLVLTPSGVEASVVKISGKDNAEAFLAKVKDVKKAATFKVLADEAKHRVENITINARASVPDEIKSAAAEFVKVPSVHMLKADGKYWIILATSKTQAQYRDINDPEIKEGLRKMISDERKNQQMEQLIEQLKKDLNVVENTAYFDNKEADRRAMMEKVMAAQQQQGQESEEDVSNMTGAAPVKM